jgi:flavin reductase (DIM6/NTAB) family NADH-FMN oxidoreductase RutF
MTIDPRDFRAALGRFATGVAVATARSGDGQPVGMTINSFASVSLDPPLVLWSLARSSQYLDAFSEAGHYAVNVLREEQRDLSVRFSIPLADRWEGVDSDCWETGAPILRGCLATVECVTDAVHEGGDHIILVGRVIRLASDHEGRPLLYYSGRYATIG